MGALYKPAGRFAFEQAGKISVKCSPLDGVI
jgi:hypothetical protein